jgi:integrase
MCLIRVTGCRRSEIVTLPVARLVEHKHGGLCVAVRKTKKAGGRNIPVHARLIDAIAKQAASVPADGLLFPTIGNPDSYGDAIREDIMDALGMPGMKDPATGKRPSSSVFVPCHSFRHAFVTETTGLPGEIANSDVKNLSLGARERVRPQGLWRAKAGGCPEGG